MKKNVIVSLADSNYFELLNELVDSIKNFEKSKDTAICILDAGLTDEQKMILSSLDHTNKKMHLLQLAESMMINLYFFIIQIIALMDISIILIIKMKIIF